MLSVIIPSRTEAFLNQTIQSVLDNATGDIEVIVVLDGYDEVRNPDPRVRYILLEKQIYTQKRHGINQAVEIAMGDYIMALDAHCMVAPGFDEQLVKDHQPTWVQVPRRHRLDAQKWCIQIQSDDRPPIDYSRLDYKKLRDNDVIIDFKWDARTRERWHIPIDETWIIQGSCWFMTKDWFKAMGFMQIEGYTGWGGEGEEISFTTWRAGGKVMVNKNTWYAHLHKGPKYGRGYSLPSRKPSEEYSYNYWVHENKKFFLALAEKFDPFEIDYWDRIYK